MSYHVRTLGEDAAPAPDCLSAVRSWWVSLFWANSNAQHHYEFLGGQSAVEKMVGAAGSQQFAAFVAAAKSETRAPLIGFLQTAKQRVVGARLSLGEETLVTENFPELQRRLRACRGSLLPVGLGVAALWLVVR